MALAPNHGWFVKIAARAAMMAVPDRREMLQYVVGPNKSDEFAYEVLDRLCKSMNSVREGLWKYYRDNKIDKLP